MKTPRPVAVAQSVSAVLLLLFFAACGGGYSGGGGNGGGGGNQNPPAAPTGLTATAGNGSVALSWTASSGATSYKVSRSTTSGGPYTLIVTIEQGSITNATDLQLLNGTTYYYVVAATNSYGTSANSSQVSAVPSASAPAIPTGLTAAPLNAEVDLQWSPSVGALTYIVKRSTVSGGPYTTIANNLGSGVVYLDRSVTNGTTYYYVVAAMNANSTSANSSEVSATPALQTPDVTVTVNPSQTNPISPWIYGINSYSGIPNPPNVTFDRAGGNRWTAYNWENNYSNAGSDFGPYSNDNFLSSSTVPAEAVRSFIAGDHTAGLASLMTVQLQGLVSADGNGNVSVASPPDMTRFKTVVDQKSTVSSVPFTTTPDTTDADVFMDEFLWALDQKFSGENIFGASPALPTFVSLDNEPELWNSTHLEVQGSNPVTSDAYITKAISLAEALKDQFPNVIIFGPVHYGFQGIYSWQGELSPTPSGTNWFPDKYLAAMQTASNTYGKPVVDVYDFHWYPEVYDTGNTRITSMSAASLSAADVQLIVQAPRDLWDPTFNDAGNSNPWIYNELGQTPVQIIPRLQAKISAEFPAMKGLSISEYEGGGWNNIAGTIAEADMLGIFGDKGLFAAAFWPPSGTYDYALAGFRAFRGFNGASANFGDTSVQATSSDVSKVAVHASEDSATPGRVVFVAINRSTSSQVTDINGMTLSGTASIYQMTASSAQGQVPVHPVLQGTMPVSGTSLQVTLPALSVTTIEIQ